MDDLKKLNDEQKHVRKVFRKQLNKIFNTFRDMPSAKNFSNLMAVMMNYQEIRNNNWIIEESKEEKN